MKRNLIQFTSLIVVGFVFGLFIASMVGPIAVAGPDPTPTCCHEVSPTQGDCNFEHLWNKPWITICNTEGGCYCQGGEWQPYAHCVCT